tara:strand:- start:214 stop:561 length:348 start_codon:yes stop_codon:yes gene_type:complete
MPQGKGTYGTQVGRPSKSAMGMRVKKKDMDMYRGGGMYGNMKEKMMEDGAKLEIVTMKKGGKNVKKVMIDAPAGHHWMDMGDGKFVLMAHKGEFKPHKGAMLKAPFEIITVHSDK